MYIYPAWNTINVDLPQEGTKSDAGTNLPEGISAGCAWRTKYTNLSWGLDVNEFLVHILDFCFYLLQ